MRRIGRDRLGFVTSQKVAYWFIVAGPVLALWAVVAAFTWWPLFLAVVVMWWFFRRSTRRQLLVQGGRVVYRGVWGEKSFEIGEVVDVFVTLTGVTVVLGRETINVPNLIGVELANARESTARDVRSVLGIDN